MSIRRSFFAQEVFMKKPFGLSKICMAYSLIFRLMDFFKIKYMQLRIQIFRDYEKVIKSYKLIRSNPDI